MMVVRTRKFLTFALLGVIMFILKFAMSWLPNIELSTLLTAIFSMIFGLNSLPIILVYVLLEIIIYGFDIWAIGYLYIWVFFAIIFYLIWKLCKNFTVMILSIAIAGIIFGWLYFPIYWGLYGFQTAIAWCLAGVSFDLLHAGGNLILAILLLKPIYKAIKQLKEKNGL